MLCEVSNKYLFYFHVFYIFYFIFFQYKTQIKNRERVKFKLMSNEINKKKI